MNPRSFRVSKTLIDVSLPNPVLAVAVIALAALEMTQGDEMADRRAELRAEMTAAHDELLRNLDAFNDQEWGQQTYDAWNRKDTFAHLASIQARQRAQIQCALDGSPWNPDPADVNDYNALEVGKRKGWTTEQVRDEYEREQASTIGMLDKMSEADLQRTYQHPVRGARSIESVFEQVANHTRNHAADIMAAKQGATS